MNYTTIAKIEFKCSQSTGWSYASVKNLCTGKRKQFNSCDFGHSILGVSTNEVVKAYSKRFKVKEEDIICIGSNGVYFIGERS